MLPPSHMKVIAPFCCEERSWYLPMTFCSCTCKLRINICLINFIDNWIAKFSHDFNDLGFPCIQCEWAYFTVVNSKTAMNSWTVYKMTNILLVTREYVEMHCPWCWEIRWQTIHFIKWPKLQTKIYLFQQNYVGGGNTFQISHSGNRMGWICEPVLNTVLYIFMILDVSM